MQTREGTALPAMPSVLHFCWIGAALPWTHAFALLSASARSGLDRIVLHHVDALDEGPALAALRGDARIVLARLDPAALLARAGAEIGVGGALAALYRAVPLAVQRADILRAAILFLEGGIYLDLDTVTVADLRGLLCAEALVGHEVILWPPGVRQSRSPLVWARQLALDVARTLCRGLPGGWAMFRRIDHLYPRAVNNAAMGACPGAALFAAYLRAMAAVAAPGALGRASLGPHLLGAVIARQPEAVVIHAPPVFNVLGPVISLHWFRIRRRLPGSVLTAQTRVVHWYASVLTPGRAAGIDPGYVRRHRNTQLYSSLVWDAVPQLAALPI